MANTHRDLSVASLWCMTNSAPVQEVHVRGNAWLSSWFSVIEFLVSGFSLLRRLQYDVAVVCYHPGRSSNGAQI